MSELSAQFSKLARRQFLGSMALTGVGAAVACEEAFCGAGVDLPPLVDVNVNLFQWPYRRVSGDQTPILVETLRRHGVRQAWVGSFEALLHRDLGAVNRRLFEECQRFPGGLLVPFGTVNPKLPDWQEELRRIEEQYRMPGVRLFPDHHSYTLDDPDFVELLRLAASRKLIVQIVLMSEDERTVHPIVNVPQIDPKPLLAVVSKLPELRLVLLNPFRVASVSLLAELASAGNVYVDIAGLEGVGGLENLVKVFPAGRVLFGSYFPVFYFESAKLKLIESVLGAEISAGICAGNADRLLGKS